MRKEIMQVLKKGEGALLFFEVQVQHEHIRHFGEKWARRREKRRKELYGHQRQTQIC